MAPKKTSQWVKFLHPHIVTYSLVVILLEEHSLSEGEA